MHREFTGLFIGLAVAAVAIAGDGSRSSAADAETARQLRSLEREWVNAEINRDAASLRRILDERFVATFGGGAVLDKEAFIGQVLGDRTDKMLSQDFSDQTMRIDRDTAVIVETDTIRGNDNGEPYTRVFRITTTYTRHQGRWWPLAEHLAAVRPPVNLAAEEVAIRKADAEWLNAAQSRDLEAWVSYYATDVVLLPPNAAAATPRASVRKPIAELLALPNVSIAWHPTRVEVARSGELAYLTGAYTLSYIDARGATVADRGKLLEVWKKQIDGSWKCSVDTWNSDLPLAAPAK